MTATPDSRATFDATKTVTHKPLGAVTCHETGKDPIP